MEITKKEHINKTELKVTKEIKQEIIFRNEFNERIYLGKDFSNDAVKLGKKKTWKPTKEQIKSNIEIDESLKLTKLATAETKNLFESCNDMKKTRSEMKEKYADKAWVFQRISEISSFKLEKKMLTIGYIRVHFKDCLQLINDYKEFSQNEEYREELEKVKMPIEILSKRIKCYLEQNRISEKGDILEDTKEAESFKYTEEMDKFFEKQEKDERDFDPEELLKNKEEILARKEVSEKKFSEMNSSDRIASISVMEDFIKITEESLKKAEDLKKEESNEDNIVKLREKISEYKDDLLEAKTVLALAKAEKKYLEAEDKEREEIKKEAENLSKDYRRLVNRLERERLPFVFGKESFVTKERAINSDSDIANYEFKYRLKGCAEKINATNAQTAEFKKALIEYCKVTHYSVDATKESNLLLKVIKLKKAEGIDKDAIKEAEKLLEKLNKTGDFPEWSKIPESMRLDFTSSNEGKVPEETSAGKQKGSYRNAALTSSIARKWEILDKDTPIFAHEPTVNDLRQGKVSNCYMIASTTSLINYDPELIKKCIKDNGDGSVTVRLFKHAQRSGAPMVPVFIRIPKAIPKLRTGGAILSSGALWMQLIERAAAQVGMFREGRKGYQSLWYGTGDEWLSILTGTSRNSEDMTDDLFEEIMHAKEKGFIYHAGSKDDAGAGMNSGHAYTVIGAEKVGNERFVILRNPYANMSRVVSKDGKISKSTTFMSSSADETNGQFSIPFEEFIQKMKRVTFTDMNEAFPKEFTKEGKEKNLNTIAQEEEAARIANIEADKKRKEEKAKREKERALAKAKEAEKAKKEKKPDKLTENKEEKKNEKKEDTDSSSKSVLNLDEWLEDDDF